MAKKATAPKKENKKKFSLAPLFSRLKSIKYKSPKFYIPAVALLLLPLIYFLLPTGYSLNERFSKPVVKVSSVDAPGDSSFNGSSIFPRDFVVRYAQSVSDPNRTGYAIEEGISIHPNIAGTWQFMNRGASLYFTPKTDWTPNTKYKVSLSKKIFSENVKVSERDFTFNSPTFAATLSSSDFYEDPRDAKSKQAIATFTFNYPIDTKELKDKISVKSLGGDKYDFTFKIDEESKRILYVNSENLKIKKNEDFVEIKIKNIKNAYNNEPIANDVIAKVKIPSSSTFFKLNSVTSNIIENETKDNEPEQILFVNFSTSVKTDVLKQYMTVYKYNEPCYNVRDKVNSGTHPANIKGAKEVKLTSANTSEDTAKTQVFKYDIRERNSCMVVRINRGLSSVEDFALSADEQSIIDIPNYPMEAKVAFEGSILSLNGDKTLAFSSRGVKKLEVEVARIDVKDLNHLVTQTYGDFSHPYFRNYSFDEYNISEVFRKDLSINMEHPAKRNYSSIDMGDYFKEKRGIFIVNVKGWDGNNTTSNDRRLIIITDLGVIVKDNADKTHDVFVSRFASGTPVYGAKVEILGKNGLPVLTTTTNNEGLASIPNFQDFKAEKEPVAYMVKQEGDVSFMPIDKGDRKLDFSRFDVEGVYDSSDKQNEINGFVFSDRGIYRPGETAYFGSILRYSNLNVPNSLPFRIIVRNPNGDEVASTMNISDAYGYMESKYVVPRSARIGEYSINVYLVEDENNPHFVTSSSFKVEEFMPDTMKIKLELEGAKTKGWYIKYEIKANILLQNLYGNPASHHRISADSYAYPTSFSFKEFSEYTFRDPLRARSDYAAQTYQDSYEDNITDDEGKAEYTIDFKNLNTGTYRVSFNTQGYELDSGRSVSASSSLLYSPNLYLVGYKTDGDLGFVDKNSKRTLSFIAIDNELNQITKDNLSLSLYQIKTISSLVEMPNGTYRYQMVEKDELIKEEEYVITAKGVDYLPDTSNSGDFYVKIEDKDSNLLAKVNYTVVGAGNVSHNFDKDATMSIKLDKSEYNHFEEIKMQIKAPYEGYGLITIEQDKVYAYKWFKASTKNSTQTIELPNTVEGSAYVNVAYIRDANSTEIFMPPLSYSVAPISINKDKRKVKIELGVPEVVKPGEELVIKYKTDRDSKIILYGVNEGILQVAKYKLPDPLSYFMQKRALRVATLQIMDLILPDMRLVRKLKAAGGDDAELNDPSNNLNPFARKQDEVVAFWSGVIEAGEDEQEYTYKVPETFNGQITVMAIGVTKEHFGRTSEKALVRGDFALTPNGPFNVSPNDVFEIGTSVANMVDGSGNDYEVKVSLTAPDGLEVVGDKEQIIKLKEKGEASIRFKVKALDKLGSADLIFTAQSTKDKTKVSKMPYHIGIRPSNPYTTDLQMGFEKSKLKLKNFVEPMFNEYRNQQVIASTSPLVLTQGLVQYLENFPHACTEQTVSKVFPAMVVFFEHPELLGNVDIYQAMDNAVYKLSERQTMRGGFTAWTGYSSNEDEFASVYAGHFLTLAKERQFNIPSNLMNKNISYLKEIAASEPRELSDTNTAYAIYVLTLNGETTTNYLINLEQYFDNNFKKEWKKSLNASYMAASYKLLQDEVKARSILGSYKLNKDGLNDARHIYLMAKHFRDDFNGLGEDGIKALLKPLKENRFNTINSAASLLALSAYENDKGNDANITFKDKNADLNLFARVDVSDKDKSLELKSDKPFFYVVSQQGFLRENPKSEANGIEISKQYLNKDGNKVSSAKLGDEITVKLTLRSLRDECTFNVAVVDLIPGCFEITRNSISASNTDYAEEREDRALIYMSVCEAEEITYKAKIIAKGDFVVPPAYVSALYETDVKANTKASSLNVEE